MNYLQTLRRIHRQRRDIGLYFEIGCRQGRSLSTSRARSSIAVDPDFRIVFPLVSPTRLFRMTSDEFFATEAQHALHRPIDLAFIDGMHLSEFALRDFMNVEKHAHPEAWVLFDDVLPADLAYASRTRKTARWTGDIYKLVGVLRRYRPDLEVIVLDVEMKGLMLVRGLDPHDTVLRDAYADIEAELMRDDDPVLTLAQIRDLAAPVPPETIVERV